MWVIKELEGKFGQKFAAGTTWETGYFEKIGSGEIWRGVHWGSWDECARLCNFLNGGEGVFPMKGFYKGVPVTET